MAGSYRHVTRADGSFDRGIGLIDHLGDASEALEEMHDMIGWMAKLISPDDPRKAIHEAWRYGHARPPENTANEALCGFDAFWEADDEAD